VRVLRFCQSTRVLGYAPREGKKVVLESKEVAWVSEMSMLYLVNQGSVVRRAQGRFVVERKDAEDIEVLIMWPKDNGGVYLCDAARRVFIRQFEARIAEQITHPDLKEKVSYRRVIHLQVRRYAKSVLGTQPYEPYKRSS
jgi:CRISPR/Cas system-associated endonuclease Cas1